MRELTFSDEELDALEREAAVDTTPEALTSSRKKWVLAVERYYHQTG